MMLKAKITIQEYYPLIMKLYKNLLKTHKNKKKQINH